MVFAKIDGGNVVNVKKAKRPVIEEPVIEVIVRSGNEELAVIAFFPDGAGGFDVVVGVGDPATRDSLKAAFIACADAMGKAAFRPTRAIGADGMDYTPPF